VGDGPAGKVNITTDVIKISGNESGLFTNAFRDGAGGNITVDATVIEMTDGASIAAQGRGLGGSGNVTLAARDSIVLNNSSVSTEAIQTDGWNIIVQAGRMVHLVNSEMTARVKSGTGSGGNITIDPQFVIVDHSRIIADAFGGNGGNITMSAGVFLASPDSIMDASSALGISGTVSIQSPVTNLSGTLAPLPQGFLQAAALLQAHCAARMAGKFSSFIIAGRDAIPPEPGGFLPSLGDTMATTRGAQADQNGDGHDYSKIASGLLTLNVARPVRTFLTEAVCGS
jgi:hypothetical protein